MLESKHDKKVLIYRKKKKILDYFISRDTDHTAVLSIDLIDFMLLDQTYLLNSLGLKMVVCVTEELFSSTMAIIIVFPATLDLLKLSPLAWPFNKTITFPS